MDKKTWTKRRIVGVALIIPAVAVNYAAVIGLEEVFNFQHFFILSAVLVGDVLGMGINLILTDWNYRMIHKYGGADDKLSKPTIPCSFCKVQIPNDSRLCPYCGQIVAPIKPV